MAWPANIQPTSYFANLGCDLVQLQKCMKISQTQLGHFMAFHVEVSVIILEVEIVFKECPE